MNMDLNSQIVFNGKLSKKVFRKALKDIAKSKGCSLIFRKLKTAYGHANIFTHRITIDPTFTKDQDILLFIFLHELMHILSPNTDKPVNFFRNLTTNEILNFHSIRNFIDDGIVNKFLYKKEFKIIVDKFLQFYIPAMKVNFNEKGINTSVAVFLFHLYLINPKYMHQFIKYTGLTKQQLKLCKLKEVLSLNKKYDIINNQTKLFQFSKDVYNLYPFKRKLGYSKTLNVLFAWGK